jgi:hypothetical protein
MDDWPFDDAKNLAVITLRQIMKDGQPILHVTHDSDDGGWQFLGWDTPRVEDAMVVAFSEVIRRDSSLKELADLPLGWHAWRRGPNDPWERAEA